MARDLNYFFEPKGIAVVGASPHANSGGNNLLKNITRGYAGSVYPVNPKHDEIMGLKAYPSVSAINGAIDLAIVFVPAPQTPEVLRECVAKGLKGAILENAGFAEVGAEGKTLQDECVAIARKGALRLWGPNCMGLIDMKKRYVFSFMLPGLWDGYSGAGGISLIVQSGLLSAGFIMSVMSRKILGLAKVCSIGNKSDIDEIECLEFLLDDPDTNVIALYLESLAQGRRFQELAKSSVKPIVVLKGGKSDAGARASLSHTASLAGNYPVFRAALQQAGVREADDFFEMVDIARCLEKGFDWRPEGPGRVAVLTYSGASGIVTADHLQKHGLDLATLLPETVERLKKKSPPWMPVNNPVDYWPAIEKHGVLEAFKEGLSALYADPGVDGIILHLFAGVGHWALDLLQIMDGIKNRKKPVLVWIVGLKDEAEQMKSRLEGAGWPVFDELQRLVKVMTILLQKR
jgi:acyl-CoA synthetase (NDP forming)